MTHNDWYSFWLRKAFRNYEKFGEWPERCLKTLTAGWMEDELI